MDCRHKYKCKIIIFLGENIGEDLSNPESGKAFLKMASKAQATKGKVVKLDLIKMKSFYVS